MSPTSGGWACSYCTTGSPLQIDAPDAWLGVIADCVCGPSGLLVDALDWFVSAVERAGVRGAVKAPDEAGGLLCAPHGGANRINASTRGPASITPAEP